MFEKSFNAPYIVLIPKKKGAKELRDFRPISLIGNFYMLLSKVLTERIKRVMYTLVDSQQMAVNTPLVYQRFTYGRFKDIRK